MYVGWSCEGNIPIKYYNNKYYNSNLPAITKKTGNAESNEAYWCSVTVPTQEPLEQFFTVDYQLTNIKINGKSLLLQMININEKFPFTYPINADDKIDITIKNVISQTCLKGEIKYYDKEGVVRKLDTNYLGWTCN